MRAFAMASALALLLCASGCFTNAFLYTNVHYPASRDMHGNRFGTKMVTLDMQEIHEPVTSAGIGIEWDSQAIGDCAKCQGLKQIDFADVHLISILGGLYRSQTIEVWGE